MGGFVLYPKVGDYMTIIEMELKDVIPYARNAKKHDKKQIDNVAESIKQFGFAQPVVVDKDNNIIIGHCRCLAAKKLKIKTIPVVKMEDLSPEEANKLRLLDNKLNESEWDFDLLSEDIPALDFTGFEIDWNIPTEPEEVEIQEDEVPEIDETAEPKAKLGDIYQLGNHRLMCGDSTKAEDVEALMNGEKADMVFTDPPYGNGESGKYGRGQLGVQTIKGDEDLTTFRKFVDIIPTDKMIYFLQWRTLSESLQCVSEKGLKINTVGVWDKKNAGLNGSGGISEQWEAVVFSGNIKYKKFGGNVFNAAREHMPRENQLHPHRKPQKLLCDILGFVDGVQTIIDVFGGSGSTLIACEQTNRKCLMMEYEPKYVDVIIKRWEEFTGQKAVKIN